jgi:hypothetical protein
MLDKRYLSVGTLQQVLVLRSIWLEQRMALMKCWHLITTYPSNSEAMRIASESATLPIIVYTNNTERLRITSAGLVGIGTASVNALLEVNNSTAGGEVQRIEGNYDGSGSVILTNWRRAGGSVAAALKYNDDSSPLCMSIGTTTSHEFRIRTADTDAITIDTSQRVGIGTSSPEQPRNLASTAALRL